MAAEGGYAASGQFQAIADSAAAAVLSVQKLGTEFALLGASVGTISAVTVAFAQLQQTLVLTNSVAQGNAQQLKEMDKAVRDLSLGFRYSANEGAKALYDLSSAGFTVGESLRALTGVTLLAQGTLSSLSNTADTVANVITAFNLTANDSMRIANLFAAAISVTQATMDKLAYSMRYVAPVAHSMGASIEETTVALSALYNAGNRGQQGGTLLRDILVRLVNPSKEAAEVMARLGVQILDADGKTRNFVDIFRQMSRLNLSPITLSKIFEQRGLAGAETLLQAFDPKVFEKKLKDADFAEQVQKVADRSKKPLTEMKTMWDYLTVAETNTNFATKLAIEQNNTMASSFERAKNAVTEVGITIGEVLAPGLTALANSITESVRAFRNLDDGTKSFYATLPLILIATVGIGKALQGISSILPGAISGFAGLSNQIRNLTSSYGAAQTAQSRFVSAASGLPLAQAAGGITQAQYFRQQNIANPGSAPSVPTSALGNIAAGAAGAAGVVATVVGSVAAIATTILGLISIGAVVALAWPLVKEWLNREKGTSLTGVTPSTAPEEIKSIMSTSAKPLEKEAQLRSRMEKRGEDYLFFEQVLKDQQKDQEAAKKALKESIVRALELQGLTTDAAKIKEGSDEVLKAFLEGSFGSTRARQVSRDLIKKEDFVEQQKKFEDARVSIKDAKTSIENANIDLNALGEANFKLANTTGYKDAEAAKVANEKVAKLTKESQLVIIIDGYLKNIEKQAREAQVAAAKARAALSDSPIDALVADLAAIQLDTLNKVISAGDKLETEYNQHLAGAVATNDSIRHSIKDIFAGRDYTKIILDEAGNADEYRDPEKYKGINTLLAEGAPAAVILKALQRDKAIIEANANTDNEEVKRHLHGFIAGRIAQIEATLDQNKTASFKSLFEMIEKQRSNRDFDIKMRDALIGYQNNFLTAIVEASGQAVPGLKLKVDLSNLQKQFQDALRDIDKQRLELLKKIGAENPNISEGELKQKFQVANDASARLSQAAQNAYIQQAKNVINAAVQGQQKVLSEIIIGVANAELAESQIARQLDLLYSKLQLPTPKQYEAGSIALAAREEAAKIVADIERTKQEILQLQQRRSALIDAAQAGRTPTESELPKLPLSVVGGPPEQMGEAIKRATSDFEQRFGIKLTGFTTGFETILNTFLAGLGKVFGGTALVQGSAQQGPVKYLLPGQDAGSGGPTVGSTAANYRASSSGGTSTISGLDAATVTALNNAAAKINVSPSAIAMMIDLESKWNTSAMSPTGTYKGLTQMGPNTLGYNPNATTAPQQIDSYGEFLKQYKIPEKLDATGIDLSKLSQGVQAAILQGFQFSPNAGKGLSASEPPQWLKDFAAGNPNTPTTKSAQAGALGNTSIADMSRYYDEVNSKADKFTQLTKEANDAQKAGADMIPAQIAANDAALASEQRRLEGLKEAKRLQDEYNKSKLAVDISKYDIETQKLAEMGKQVQVSENAFLGLSYAVQKAQHDMGNTAKLVSDVYTSAANSIATNLTALITGTQKDWKKALQNIANDIATTIIKALILRTITGIVGGGFGIPTGVSGNILGNATGNAYTGGGPIMVPSYGAGASSNDMYNSPTLFNFAQGGKFRKGVLGEAGPEAIMPLSRGSDGKLGVKVTNTPITPIATSDRGGGNGSMSYSPAFHFYGDGQDSPTPNAPNRSERNRMISMQKELDREMEATFLRVASKHQRSGGMFNPSGQRLGFAGPQ